MKTRIFVVGLTGGIASGKSLVADLFASLNVPVIDADVIARSQVARGSLGLAAVAASFGKEILDKERGLNRAKMREIIFSNPVKKQLLEDILHPLIREEAITRLNSLTAVFALYVVPLLVDKNMQDQVDRVLLVDTSEQLQIERLMKRDDCDRKQACQIVKSQASREQRLSAADDVISNEGDRGDVRQQVMALYKKYRIMGSSKNR